MKLLLIEGNRRERGCNQHVQINHFEKGSEIITQGCEENSTILYGTAHGMKFGVIISIVDWQSANGKYKICP